MADAAVEVRIIPANKASWDDLEEVLGGATCHGGRCYCQRFKLGWNAWPGDDLERAHMLREQTATIPARGKDVPWGELQVGHGSIFAAAGFAEVSRPTLRRAVMRIDF